MRIKKTKDIFFTFICESEKIQYQFLTCKENVTKEIKRWKKKYKKKSMFILLFDVTAVSSLCVDDCHFLFSSLKLFFNLSSQPYEFVQSNIYKGNAFNLHFFALL